MVVKHKCPRCGKGNLYVDKDRVGGLYYTCYLCAREFDLNFNPLRGRPMENFCPDAYKLFKKKILCTEDYSPDCPIVKNCPRLILEDAMDDAIPKAIEAMVRLIKQEE